MSRPLPSSATPELAAPVTGHVAIKLSRFHFTGTHLIAADELARELSGFTGRELGTKELHDAAQTVANTYLRRGMMARVRISDISVKEGVAEITVEELRVGKFHVEYPTSTRISADLVDRFLAGAVSPGMPVPLAHLERSIEVLNTQPGVAAALGIDPGTHANEVDIRLRITDRPSISGRLYTDNHGVREIGQERLGMNLRIDNTLGLAERITIHPEASSGSALLTVAASLPVGDAGVRGGVEATTARFRARRAGAALELQGNFERRKGFLQQTLLRGKPFELKAEYALQRTEYRDLSIFGNLQNRSVDAAMIRLDGMARQGPETTRAGITVENGRADLSRNSGDLALDASAKVHGSFWRLNWRLGHELTVGQDTFIVRANGQFADRNLDATQKFALGGHNAVRAYPEGEALGDEGWLATAEWRRHLTETLVAALFLDGGGIKVNTKPWTAQHNRYDLASLGTGLSWVLPERVRMAANIARQLGNNPVRNADGTDSDGRNSRWRAWLSMQHDF